MVSEFDAWKIWNFFVYWKGDYKIIVGRNLVVSFTSYERVAFDGVFNKTVIRVRISSTKVEILTRNLRAIISHLWLRIPHQKNRETAVKKVGANWGLSYLLALNFNFLSRNSSLGPLLGLKWWLTRDLGYERVFFFFILNPNLSNISHKILKHVLSLVLRTSSRVKTEKWNLYYCKSLKD